MFENFKSFFALKKKSASFGVSGSSARVRGWQEYHAFTKGQDFENAYPHINRIASEFMSIRPYGVDANGKPIEQSRVMDAIYRPNLEMSGADFREALAVMSLVHSKVYVLVWHEENGCAVVGGGITADNIAGFTILENVVEEWRAGEKFYKVGQNTFTTNEVIELRGGINPYNLNDGYSPSVASRKWASLDDYIASYQAGFFENGAVPAGEFVVTASTPKEFNEIVDTLQAKHRGSGRNNNIVYTHAPVDPLTGKPMTAQIQWIPYATANNQLGLGEIFSQANKKIDSSFGVPASVRGVNENNTYASVRIDEQIFLKYTIKPFALRIWTKFTHELNRITGGIGFFITFDLEEVGIADEEKSVAERKAVELSLIERGLAMGYSLNSVVDAFELSNSYKLLKVEQSEPVIVNDKPEVDEGGETGVIPSQNHKYINCNQHCLKEQAKTKSPDNKSKDEIAIELIYRDLVNDQINYALNKVSRKSESGENISGEIAELPEEQIEEYVKKAEALLFSLVLSSGIKTWGRLTSVLLANGYDVQNIGKFEISDKLRENYSKQINNFTKSFVDDTVGEIAKQVKAGLSNGEDKEEIARRIRSVSKISEWRVQRIARTENHRAKGLGSVEAAVKIQNDADVRIIKEWQTVSDKPCGWCQAMNGKKVNVAESYVKKGGIVISKSKIRINDYEDVQTAGLHPNCSCVERFVVEDEDNSEESDVFDYSALDPKNPEYMHPHEQDFYERLLKEFDSVGRIPKGDSEATSDFMINGSEWELKSVLKEELSRFTIRNEIFRATDKGKRNIFIDNYRERHDVERMVKEAKRHISIDKNNKAIDSLVVVSGSRFIKIK